MGWSDSPRAGGRCGRSCLNSSTSRLIEGIDSISKDIVLEQLDTIKTTPIAVPRRDVNLETVHPYHVDEMEVLIFHARVAAQRAF